MSTAIIINLTAIAVIITGWTAAVWAFYTRLDDTRPLPRTARSHKTAQTPATPRPQPTLASTLN